MTNNWVDDDDNDGDDGDVDDHIREGACVNRKTVAHLDHDHHHQ